MRCRFLTLLVLCERRIDVLHAKDIMKLVKVVVSNGSRSMADWYLVFPAHLNRALVSLSWHVRRVRFLSLVVVSGATTVNHAKPVFSTLCLYRMAKDSFCHGASADIA